MKRTSKRCYTGSYEHIDEYGNRWLMTGGSDGLWTLECAPDYAAGILHTDAPEIPAEYVQAFTECPLFITKRECLEEISTVLGTI